MLPTVEETRGYDFQDPENREKWRGLYINALRKLLEQSHPTLNVEESALEYVESLCLRILAILCAVPSPLTVQDVEERVTRSFPTPLDKWTLSDAKNDTGTRRKKQILPSDKLHQMLQKEVLLYKVDVSVSVFMTCILEFICADVLKLAGNFVKKISQKSDSETTITCRDIKTAMCADKVLMDMFYQETDMSNPGTAAAATEPRGRRGSLSYAELVRDLLTDEKHFLRELNLIIRVFKDELDKILHNDTKALSLIFGNIVDIYELTVTLLGNLEDAMEMSQDSPTPYIGSCFEELAEVEEFRAYVRYANIVTRRESRDMLQSVVDDPVLSERLDTAGHGFRLAVKYYLPKLIMAPVAHVFLYHNYVLALLQIAPASEDRESFKQVECNLHPIKTLLTKALENGPKLDATLRMATRARRQLAIEKCNELSRIVDNWDNRDIGQCCNEFIREDTLSKIGPGKRIAERRAYLFDGLLLLCKPVTSLVVVNTNSISSAGGTQQLKLKEKLHVRKLELVDRPDTEEGRHMLELCPRVGPAVVLACGSCSEKRNWMCDLVMLNTKPMLDRFLDSILLDLERKHPLKLPPVGLYRFAVPDAPENIVLEDHDSRHQGSAIVPLIKGATLLKLVERLTYHIYADLNLVRTFLTTYRSFCSPAELLELLIERFQIPEPSDVYDTPRTESIENLASSDAEKLSKNTTREDWKRYRKEFQQPVKFRVINVIRHWVDQHFYDFEREPSLLERLRGFLESVDGKPMKKWVQSVLKTVQRKSGQAFEWEVTGGVSHVFDSAPPGILRHVADPDKFDWHPLTLHPLELARQLTTYEFHLYRQVKPSELVGAVWTKKDKEKTSPNLLKIIKHTTNFTLWMEKWIVESENIEERAGVVSRLLEVAIAFRDLNNFNGVLAVVAACGSASVHRLRSTFQMVPLRLTRALEEFRSLSASHFRLYHERLRSINPPCVPFFGIYLTNILHIEEGNLDYLPDTELINFSKCRKVAGITGEIQQYQNQPYCLLVEPRTRAFLESLDPFPGKDDNEITNYLYAKSLEIEPRPPNKQPPKFPRKYPDLSLKQVKVSRRSHQNSDSHHANNDDTLSVSQLSPTSGSTWDGTSVASLPMDDHRGSRQELISPRLERYSLSQLNCQLSLFKNKPNSNNKSYAKDEPPSPRDRHSPRHERSATLERKPAALSPRGAIVDAELFYSCRSVEHLPCRKPEQERVPPLLPRNSITSNSSQCEPPPVLPRRPVSPTHNSVGAWSPSAPPEPPDRPLPSPKHEQFRMPAISPKRSPAPQPPSPALQGDRGCGVAFKFPLRGAPTPSPPAPPLTPHNASSCSTPPPLPPRRRRDSTAPHTPLPPTGAASCSSGGSSPPPLPPRPTPPPALLRPAHSTILQRRHHTGANSSGAPRLPPKPSPVAVPPKAPALLPVTSAVIPTLATHAITTLPLAGHSINPLPHASHTAAPLPPGVVPLPHAVNPLPHAVAPLPHASHGVTPLPHAVVPMVHADILPPHAVSPTDHA